MSADRLAKSLRVSDMLSPVTVEWDVEGGGAPRCGHTVPPAPERQLNTGRRKGTAFREST
ncbi:hypothetical protein SAV14893_059800 [Streptomyces avermitilis]|uniref:Uncharacterized protein n=1 Tax=Streptomyces avermitilis TaxID=33903 RepID=A0A4D4MM39_STRAX|nr:hypothetical protein SAVMC3_72120 [Streptomyces avermitilis]GDY66587.1 hypothetical protein SAV14893_059800 [Streptomyces avermitilis]GDY73173.1 hypothetical protein SAV31267_026580 [Streptomyces avermitilis]GDY82278.1 hypothetical protein SAVCW2_14770 [Streptomyces avermitilis]